MTDVCPYYNNKDNWCESPENPTFIPQLLFCLGDFMKCRYYREASKDGR